MKISQEKVFDAIKNVIPEIDNLLQYQTDFLLALSEKLAAVLNDGFSVEYNVGEEQIQEWKDSGCGKSFEQWIREYNFFDDCMAQYDHIFSSALYDIVRDILKDAELNEKYKRYCVELKKDAYPFAVKLYKQIPVREPELIMPENCEKLEENPLHLSQH